MKFFISVLILNVASTTAFHFINGTNLIKNGFEIRKGINLFISRQEKKLTELKRLINELEDITAVASLESSAFFENPVNTFILMKKMTLDWDSAVNILKEDEDGLDVLNVMKNSSESFYAPTNEDLDGVSDAMLRIQEVYLLDPSQISGQAINGESLAFKPNWKDCMAIAIRGFNKEKYNLAIPWFKEALNRLPDNPAEEAEIHRYLSLCYERSGQINKAIESTLDVINLFHEDEQGLERKTYLRKNSKKIEEDAIQPQEKDEIFENYKRLCRQGNEFTPRSGELRCFYKHGPSKYLLIAPVKKEILHLSPQIDLFHEVISEWEIERLIRRATPQLKRATVRHGDGKMAPAEYRVSQTAWLHDEKAEGSAFLTAIDQRIESLTSLRLKSAEELQVSFYGIGGHYEPHFDFLPSKSLEQGNRLATFMFYLSDVESGGATVFPKLKLAVLPKKGAAIFWHNLHPNGRGNDLTKHAACPVLVGQKSVANKWIRSTDQELRPNFPLSFNY